MLFCCLKHIYEVKKKLGQLYLREQKSRVLHLSYLNAAMESFASALQPRRPALLFSLHLCLCMPVSFKYNLFPSAAKSCLPLDNTRDNKKHLDTDTRQTTVTISTASNEPCPVTYLKADNCAMML